MMRMKMTMALALTISSLTALVVSGCGATPVGLAVNVVGAAVNDADVKDKAAILMGASVADCDAVLGQPLDAFHSDQPVRDWRAYPVKNDVVGNYRYLIEFRGGRVIAVSKAQRVSDVVVDAATYAYFKEKCMGQSPESCQFAIGNPPVVSAKSLTTGQFIQLYDARVVKSVQKPYYAVLRFGADNTCTEIRIQKAVASTQRDPAAQ